MAHDHSYSLTFLKTPYGYLTSTGFTKDINSIDIIVLWSNTYGKWSTMADRIKYFQKYFTASSEIFDELLCHVDECETITFHCNLCSGHSCRYFCSLTNHEDGCKFWNGKRDELNFSRLYSL